MNTLASPTRRVLGQKDPNAPLQSPSPKKSQHVFSTTSTSPVSERPSLKRPASPSSLIPPSPRAGQKRKIQEAEGDLLAESQSSTLSHHPLSQMTGIWSDTTSQHASSPPRSMQQTKSTPNTALTSFQASQEESQAIEAEFIIHDEPSQRTLDKMHAVALPQSTSQLIPPLRPNLANETSQISLSMSSFIDFENDTAPEDDNMDYIEDASSLPKQRPQTEAETRKEMLLEKAETLRTRLQLAIFKVQTNQITKPFARLNVPKTRSLSPDIRILSSSPRSSSTIKARSVSHPAVSPETRIAQARARATMETKPTVKPLSLIPMPTLAPTTFSARWAESAGQKELEESDRERQVDLPSSPPSSQEGSDHDTHPNVATDRPTAEPRTPVQLSSPVSNPDGDSELGVLSTNPRKLSSQQHRLHQGGLTSSVVKGEAASGLLELMRRGPGGDLGVPRPGGIGMCGL